MKRLTALALLDFRLEAQLPGVRGPGQVAALPAPPSSLPVSCDGHLEAPSQLTYFCKVKF
jgi:hypothetical protein